MRLNRVAILHLGCALVASPTTKWMSLLLFWCKSAFWKRSFSNSEKKNWSPQFDNNNNDNILNARFAINWLKLAPFWPHPIQLSVAIENYKALNCNLAFNIHKNSTWSNLLPFCYCNLFQFANSPLSLSFDDAHFDNAMMCYSSYIWPYLYLSVYVSECVCVFADKLHAVHSQYIHNNNDDNASPQSIGPF